MPKACLGASHEPSSQLGPPSRLEEAAFILLGGSKSASPLQPLLISPAVSLLCLCSSILPSAVTSAAARPVSSFYQAKIFRFFMHSSHTVRLSLFFPQVPWCYLFLFLISYVRSHILPFCLLFLKLQLDSTFGTQRFIYIDLKKCLGKHIKAKKQTWKHNEMCCWDGKGPSEQSAPIKSIKRGLINLKMIFNSLLWFLFKGFVFLTQCLPFFFQYFLLFSH